MTTRNYSLTEEERQLIIQALAHTIITTRSSKKEDQTFIAKLVTLMDDFKVPISTIPLWRTYPEKVQEEIVINYMECESIDKHRAHEELDQIDDPEFLEDYRNYDEEENEQ